MMVLLNDYFHQNKLENEGKKSVSGKLEAFVGNYFVSGEGCPGETILLIYYDPKIDSRYSAVECIKENLIAFCPIIMWGGDYIRQDGQWVSRGWTYDNQSLKYEDPNSIVENNHRVLLTRARKEMILFIPNDSILDETYQYFIDMGMDII